MANHKSADKRFRQNIKKNKVNKILMSRLRTILNKLNLSIKDKNIEESDKSLRIFNSILSKAVKKGIIKKRNASRKLSSFSYKIKKII